MEADVAKRLMDAHGACSAIGRFLDGKNLEEFAASELLRSAVERQFEIVGEALGRASAQDPALNDLIPEIPRIVGLRNRLIHGHDSVDDQLIWDIAQNKLPTLRRALEGRLMAAGMGTFKDMMTRDDLRKMRETD